MAKKTELTYLFVPGSRPDRFKKAIDSGADAVIIDLEDSVGPEQKPDALANVISAIEAENLAGIYIRINDKSTKYYLDEIAALSTSLISKKLRGIFLTKVETAAELASIAEKFETGFRFIPQIETALGVHNVDEIAATNLCYRLAVGAIDLSLDLRSDADSRLLDYVYSKLVITSKVNGLLSPIGSPSIEIKDLEKVAIESRQLKGLGVLARMCIHPAQVQFVSAAMKPTAAEVQWAREILKVEGAAAQVDGTMVDLPVKLKAETILELAHEL